MEERELLFDRRGHVAILTLNRPSVGNALGGSMSTELAEAWEEVNTDPRIRAAVLTGAGRRHFCTGAQVAGLEGMADRRGAAPQPGKYAPRSCNVRKPVVTAVNGICAGGGLHFVVESDIVIASSNASFVDPHVTVGQVAALEPIQLAARIPIGEVLRMALVGRPERMSAQRAYELGLVSEVVEPDQLTERAIAIAEMIALNSPAAVERTKQAIWDSLERPLDESLRHGWKMLTEHWDHPDQREGPRAFSERRAPRWHVEGAPPDDL